MFAVSSFSYSQQEAALPVQGVFHVTATVINDNGNQQMPVGTVA